MADIEDFLSYVTSKVPDCGDDTFVTNEIRNAIIEFATESRFHRYNVDPLNVIANIAEYEVDVPRYHKIVQVESVMVDGEPIDPKEKTEMAALYKDWKNVSGQKPEYYTMTAIETLRLVRKPSVAITLGLDIEISLKPSRAATTVDDRFFEEYVEAIAYGAAYRILMTPDYRDRVDQGVLKFYLDKFEDGKADALRRSNAYYTHKRIRRATPFLP